MARHFARQLTDQGWSPDATWSGNTTAGSAWSVQPNADTRLLGTLHVTAVDNGQFNVILHVVKL